MPEQKIDKKIEQWKSRLIDLTKRNKLLNFKGTKSTLQIEMNVDDFFTGLLKNEKLQVSSYIDLEKRANQLHKKQSKADLKGAFPDEDEETISNNIGKVAQALEKQLNTIRLMGKSSIDEKGVNTLFLACGFLSWTEIEHSNVLLKSPLVLIPISLSRQSARDPYYIERFDDDMIVNPVLEQKMKIDFGIDLSDIEFPEELDLNSIVQSFSDKLNLQTNWETSTECYIGLFSFNKLVMYKDFEDYEELVKENPFIKELAGEFQDRDKEYLGKDNIPDIKEYDRVARSEESYQILDADSSQQEAIVAAKKGASFVMQGPPGTGKSQTISNIISELLAEKKKVLFVSEKRAALEVVKSRLDDKELGDFCLDLHSHNSNKKAVLDELNKTLNHTLNTQHNNNQAFKRLDETKKQLNQYVSALHTIVDPLRESPFSVHGKLAKLDSILDVLLDIPDVQSYNQEKLFSVTEKLKRLEKTRFAIVYSGEHMWEGALPKETSYQLETEITVKFKELMIKLNQTFSILSDAVEIIGYEGIKSLNGVDFVLDIGEQILNKPQIPESWLTEDGNKHLSQAASALDKYKELFGKYHKVLEKICLNFQKDIIHINYEELEQIIERKHQETVGDFLEDYNDFLNKILDDSVNVQQTLNQIMTSFNVIKGLSKNLNELLKSDQIISENHISMLSDVYELIKGNPRPTVEWFDLSKKDELREVLRKNKRLFNDYNNLISQVSKEYQVEILNENIKEVLARYQTNYSSGLRFLKGSYRRDRNFLQTFLIDKKKVSYEKALKDLRLITNIQKLKTEIDDKSTELKAYFGSWYQEEKTDWQVIEENLEKTFKLILLLNDKAEAFKPFIINLEEVHIQSFNEILASLIKEKQLISDLFKPLQELIFSKISAIEPDEDIRVIEKAVQILVNPINEIIDAKNKIKSFASDYDLSLGIDKLKALFDDLHQLKVIKNLIMKEESRLYSLYGNLYNGVQTDWFAIKTAIDWTEKIEKNFVGWFPGAFISVLNDELKLAKFLDIINKLKSRREMLEGDLQFYERIFNLSHKKFNGESIYSADIQEVIVVLENLANNTSKLHEWVTYKEALSDVEENGLGEFVKKLFRKNLENRVHEIFIKRFYRLWLDMSYQKLEQLKKFRIDQHKKLLSDFKVLDAGQLETNKNRINLLLTQHKEEYINNIAGKSSELAILKREIQKKKKHKPIRKLFSEITNLLLSLKPCMMMSPLSVSQFVDPSVLNFDVVIFDEASQIRPEDAIGSIVRGKQLIIAGDDKQLPPTSFFSQQIEIDDEFIDEEDEEIYESFESILDESALFMPQISLKWHYRSKQESLIAFSNRYIYNNELYTFPNAEKKDNDGVSFVHVKEGIYDRGKSQKNIKEAEKVAELVIEHIKRSPERSLGIIAFSQAQQVAIQDKIEEIKLDHPELEYFFSENQLESFFVKNIENVQGDERDTIILSVGYGKDVNGNIYHNFGPLNKDGGERRLNVAVSRAKKEIKVVSSILDIDLDGVLSIK
ncbi:DUF4011 domain-containing protein [Bacillus infantis]|uniref:DUF4011 domain-containing protein n=1 Tax=Bacillus infantis TaxID=324767 RepID=UPI003CF350FA